MFKICFKVYLEMALKAILIVAATVLFGFLLNAALGGSNTTLAKEVIIEDEYGYDDLDMLDKGMLEQTARKKAAHEMAEAARQLGYPEEHDVILLAKEEHSQAHQLYLQYKTAYDDLTNRWNNKRTEYPVATHIWEYLRKMGCNKAVSAGILGNIMTESGSNTLNIQPKVKDSSGKYYGICQWSLYYHKLKGYESLDQQLDYLAATIQEQMNTYGICYGYGFNYEGFLSMTSTSSAALAFAKCYERPSAASYSQRQRNAIAAYNYFVT